MKPTNETFETCRKRVHDDAFEAQISLHMVLPLLKNDLKEIKSHYVYDSCRFLRRAIVRYLALALYRLLDKPNDKGQTGITASIASLLRMAKSRKILDKDGVQKFTSELDKIKSAAADGEYDLVKELRDLRNTQIAHSLIPWNDPTEQLLAHHLVDFAEAIFNLVVKIEAALAEATGITLKDLRENAGKFESSAGQFWQALRAMPKAEHDAAEW